MHFLSAALLGLAAHASAHGLITTPAARTPGAATQAVCGAKMVAFYKADNTSYPEALHRVNPSGLGADFLPDKCNLYLCRGYQFDDNKANAKEYKAGTVVDIEVFIRIPHRGYANVSVVDTNSNMVVGEPLKKWGDGYAATLNPPKDETKFSVTVPDLAGKCAKAGDCVLQWYWFGQGQTYESCIDFTQAVAKKARDWKS